MNAFSTSLICLALLAGPAWGQLDHSTSYWAQVFEGPLGPVVALASGPDDTLFAASEGALWQGPSPWRVVCRYAPALTAHPHGIEASGGPRAAIEAKVVEDVTLALASAGISVADLSQSEPFVARYVAEPSPRLDSPYAVVAIDATGPWVHTGAGAVWCGTGTPPDYTPWPGEIADGDWWWRLEGQSLEAIQVISGRRRAPQLWRTPEPVTQMVWGGGRLWVAGRGLYALRKGEWVSCPLPSLEEGRLVGHAAGVMWQTSESILSIDRHCRKTQRVPTISERPMPLAVAGRSMWVAGETGLFQRARRLHFTESDVEQWRRAVASSALQRPLPREAHNFDGITARWRWRQVMPEVGAFLSAAQGKGWPEEVIQRERAWSVTFSWPLSWAPPSALITERLNWDEHQRRRRHLRLQLRRRLRTLLRRRWLPAPEKPQSRLSLDLRITATEYALAALDDEGEGVPLTTGAPHALSADPSQAAHLSRPPAARPRRAARGPTAPAADRAGPERAAPSAPTPSTVPEPGPVGHRHARDHPEGHVGR
ncbi:MAG: hypothetical protein ACE366_25810 [Bradymonadia bacterium]